jgi:hypothetical protein
MKKFFDHLTLLSALLYSSIVYSATCPEWFQKNPDLKNLKILLCESFTADRLLSNQKEYIFIATEDNTNNELSVSIYAIEREQQRRTRLIYQQSDLGKSLLSFSHQDSDTFVVFHDFTKSQKFHYAILTQQESNKTLIMKKFVQDKFEPVGHKYLSNENWVEVPTLVFDNDMKITLESDRIKGESTNQVIEYQVQKGYYVRK